MEENFDSIDTDLENLSNDNNYKNLIKWKIICIHQKSWSLMKRVDNF